MTDGICSDIYVLVGNRNVKFVQNFLEYFVPDHREMADEYEIPQYSDSPDILFFKATELMRYCEEHTEVPHAIYWFNNQNEDPEDAMVFYTIDGKMILGLSIEDESREQEWLIKLKNFSQSDQGCILYESPPPDNSEEFLKLTKSR
jgi:hypothetical protein